MIHRHKTAIKRFKISRPITLLIKHSILKKHDSFFDFGCGHGHDAEILRANGYSDIFQFDPYYFPDNNLTECNIVNLGYVLNVIESPRERLETLIKAFSLAKEALCISVMISSPYRGTNSIQYGDGTLSSKNTFQKYFDQSEIKNYIESILENDAIPLEPGIFVVFKKENRKLDFLSSRNIQSAYLSNHLDRPQTERINGYVQNENKIKNIVQQPALLELLSITEQIGRIPSEDELPQIKEIISSSGFSKHKLRSITFNLIDEDKYLTNRAKKIERILIFLALRKFDRNGFPKRKDLPTNLLNDIIEFFSSYKNAIQLATSLLFSTGNEKVTRECFVKASTGKLLPQALYIHYDFLEMLPPPLQVKVGIAQSLLGEIENCTLVKINRHKDKISFLAYEDFFKIAHPALLYSYSVDLSKMDIRFWDFRDRSNPPILHRKETFIPNTHPKYKLFEKLTQQEESHELLSLPEIGTREAWQKLLNTRRVTIKGHCLKRL